LKAFNCSIQSVQNGENSIALNLCCNPLKIIDRHDEFSHCIAIIKVKIINEDTETTGGII
jgi:hypothetical protein